MNQWPCLGLATFFALPLPLRLLLADDLYFLILSLTGLGGFAKETFRHSFLWYAVARSQRTAERHSSPSALSVPLRPLRCAVAVGLRALSAMS